MDLGLEIQTTNVGIRMITLKILWVHGLVIPTFLTWRKSNILFSRYLDFCTFVKSTDFKICDIIIGISSSGISTSADFFWILSTLKKKFGQMLECCNTNISIMFLAQDWRLRLEASSRLFYDFIKMTLQRDLAIFNIDIHFAEGHPSILNLTTFCQIFHVDYWPPCSFFHLQFVNVHFSPFHKSRHNWLLSFSSRFLNWKGPGT